MNPNKTKECTLTLLLQPRRSSGATWPSSVCICAGTRCPCESVRPWTWIFLIFLPEPLIVAEDCTVNKSVAERTSSREEEQEGGGGKRKISAYIR